MRREVNAFRILGRHRRIVEQVMQDDDRHDDHHLFASIRSTTLRQPVFECVQFLSASPLVVELFTAISSAEYVVGLSSTIDYISYKIPLIFFNLSLFSILLLFDVHVYSQLCIFSE